MPDAKRVPTLLLTGTIGSGKTAVATELGLVLEARGLLSAIIDLDWLNWVHLGHEFDAYDPLLVSNLTAIWPNFRAAGVQYFVLVRALQDPALLTALRAALPQANITVVYLTAPATLIAERLRRRDSGEILAEHLQETVAMAASMDAAGIVRVADVVVDNGDRPVRAVALEVLDSIGWG